MNRGGAGSLPSGRTGPRLRPAIGLAGTVGGRPRESSRLGTRENDLTELWLAPPYFLFSDFKHFFSLLLLLLFVPLPPPPKAVSCQRTSRHRRVTRTGGEGRFFPPPVNCPFWVLASWLQHKKGQSSGFRWPDLGRAPPVMPGGAPKTKRREKRKGK